MSPRRDWRTRAIVGVCTSLLTASAVGVAAAAPGGQADLAEVRAAVAPFHRTAAAQAAGWDLVPGLDHCFEQPGVGGMGWHYIDADRLDTTLDVRAPEALVYVPGPQGQRRLGAVEYIVPAAPWDDEHDVLPELFGEHFHLNEALGVYVLHVWLFEHNPDGMFEDWNPRVTCP